MRVLVLGHAEIHAAMAPEECQRAMAAVLADRARGRAYNPLRTVMAAPGAAGLMGLMPAYAAPGPEGAEADDGEEAGTFALKALCLMPGNPARGLDTHQGTVTLFDGQTGRPTAILDASALTEIRTAAVTAVATRALARDDARVLGILGAGVQARAHLRALATVRPWREVRIYAPTAAHARALAATPLPLPSAGSPPGPRPVGTTTAPEDPGSAATSGDPGHHLAALVDTPTARDAVAGADVVVTVTSSRVPVLERGWLAPHAHVNAVGASTPDACELDVETVAAAALFCDSRESVRHEAGEFRLAVEQGAISGDAHIRAELGEVLAGVAPGRTEAGQLTLFRSLGIGVEDLAAARLAVANARRRGLGTVVEL